MNQKISFPMSFHLMTVEETNDIASKVAKVLKAGDLILFTGKIGTGKTTFIKALAVCLGVKETVTSPSFVLHTIYEGTNVLLSHVDLYRLFSDEEVEEIGFEDYMDKSVTTVEWADRYSNFQPPYVQFHFRYGQEESERTLTIAPNGGDWVERLSVAFS